MCAAVDGIDPGLIAMACGSFRRGKATCGDVDVLITHPDGKSNRGVFHLILNKLKQTGEYFASFAQCPLYLHLGISRYKSPGALTASLLGQMFHNIIIIFHSDIGLISIMESSVENIKTMKFMLNEICIK